MISRHWTGLAKAERADDYRDHLRAHVLPSLRAIPGFVSVSILRRAVPDGVEFLVASNWTTLDAIRAFAGDSVERAVVAPAVEAMMVEYDRVVRHYEVIE